MSSSSLILEAAHVLGSQWRITLGGALVFALSSDQNQARTIIVLERGYGLTTSTARGLLRLGNDLAHTDTGVWIITNLNRQAVQAAARTSQSLQQVMTSTQLAWAHFTMLSGYLRLIVFGDGYTALLADEREQERLQASLIRQISERRRLIGNGQEMEEISDDEEEGKEKVQKASGRERGHGEKREEGFDQGEDAGERDHIKDAHVLGEGGQEEKGGEDADERDHVDDAHVLEERRDRKEKGEGGATGAAKRSREEMERLNLDVDESDRPHQKTMTTHVGYDLADYLVDGRQLCVGVKANGEPCARSRRPAEGPYFCCKAHKLQYKASQALSTPI